MFLFLCYTIPVIKFAGVSELADETDSKSVIRKGVWVRVPLPAPFLELTFVSFFYCETTRFPGTHPMRSIVEGWGSYLLNAVLLQFSKSFELIPTNQVNTIGITQPRLKL